MDLVSPSGPTGAFGQSRDGISVVPYVATITTTADGFGMDSIVPRPHDLNANPIGPLVPNVSDRMIGDKNF